MRPMRDTDDIPTEELGPALDQAIEARIETRNVADALSRMHVTLDSLADSRDLPSDIVASLRGIQRDVRDVAQEADSETERLGERITAIRERIEEEYDR